MMTGNERAMVFELAKSVAALGRAVESLSAHVPEGAALDEVTKAAKEGEESLREFMRLVDTEWLKNDE
jgi:hypothetical protein